MAPAKNTNAREASQIRPLRRGKSGAFRKRCVNSYIFLQREVPIFHLLGVNQRPSEGRSRSRSGASPLFRQLAGGSRCGSPFRFAAVAAPPAHGRPYGQDLVFEFRTGFASQQMQLQGDAIGQAQRPVFAGDQQCGSLPAGAS